ncbi:hypothetical protein AWB78_06481 [Caballeronia calidae]|uniref:Uncharacterized protein n=1 Tax=Caballeronia calidae TaxID=1777139 RepID=A0A158E9B7_9BURK|nr:hypothetical protein AWB78_06481 [Caballeronia calidae]
MRGRAARVRRAGRPSPPRPQGGDGQWTGPHGQSRVRSMRALIRQSAPSSRTTRHHSEIHRPEDGAPFVPRPPCAAADAPARRYATSRHGCRRRYRVAASSAVPSSRSVNLIVKMGQISPFCRAGEGHDASLDRQVEYAQAIPSAPDRNVKSQIIDQRSRTAVSDAGPAWSHDIAKPCSGRHTAASTPRSGGPPQRAGSR